MRLTGIGVGRSSATGPVLRMAEPVAEPAPSSGRPADPDAELARARAALGRTAEDLTAVGERAGGEAAAVLAAQAAMAADPALVADVAERIGAGLRAERAVFEAFEVFRGALVPLGGRIAERAADLADLCRRVLAELAGVPLAGVPTSAVPFVLVARDLAPADTALLDPALVLAIVTEEGGPTSHTAILARGLGIPAVVGVRGALRLDDGILVSVDAASGTVADGAGRPVGRTARSKPAATGPGTLADGTRVPLLANIGALSEVEPAVALGAEGVGLLRTEFLFQGARAAPGVEEQRAAYAAVAAAFPGRPVVVRVLDAGSDKPLPFLPGGREPNPALGHRGLRLLAAHPEVLRDQLAALAGVAGDVRVMAPMVAEPGEAAAFAEQARGAGIRSVGVMIEVPAAALLAERMLTGLDFVSVGTNDLAQYALAADRQAAGLARLQDPWHPALLTLIGLVGAAGAATGTPVGVCGEAAADPELAVVLVGLGATSLSMAPSALAGVRAALAAVTLDEARARAAHALAAS